MGELSGRQRALLERWLPGAETVRDHSWGLVGTTVLELRHDGRRYIAKAGDADDRHIARELTAHRHWLGPLTALGRAPALVRADDDAKLLVTRYQRGVLLQGHPDEFAAQRYRQAGELLAALHGQHARRDDGYGRRVRDKALAMLDAPHRIAPDVTERLRAEVAAWPDAAASVVPTHGDWHPRNWLVHDGVLSVIDFGRAEMRPAETDLLRLAARQFRADPSLEAAFLEGYGRDPREPGSWRRHRLGEAIGTAVWAYQVGDRKFERQGHRMIADVIDGRGEPECDG